MNYEPLTEEEFNDLKAKLSSIKDYLPENMMTYIWSTFKKVSGSTENQPCSCASAGGHWKRAVQTLRDFISKVEA